MTSNMRPRRRSSAPTSLHRGVPRRTALQALLGAGAGLAAPRLLRSAHAQSASGDDPRFLIVLTCAGGASMIDGPLALREGEVNDPRLNAFPDGDVFSVGDSGLRATRVEVNGLGSIPYRGEFDQREFVTRYADQMAALTWTGTSVNHLIAQKRSLTGNDAWGGRTLTEAVAAQYGADLLIPHVNMASGGFVEPGHDPSLPGYARGELISTPALWPLGLHGTKGVTDQVEPSPEVIAIAREWRDTRLDQESAFARTFAEDPAVQRWMKHRTETLPQLEDRDLISALNFLPESPITPLSAYGLATTEDRAAIAQAFPKILTDQLEAQAALAYLLITQGVSASVTLGPNFSPVITPGSGQLVDSPPLAFDYSHQDHRSAQALMWSRLYNIADKLIRLLEAKEWRAGSSYWDRSMIYFAGEFGRTRQRPPSATSFSSGHHLNNGSLVISPLIRGGRVYGGVDPSTTLTYGYDPMTGDPTPGREMSEAEHFSALAHALNLDVGGVGLPTVTALRG